MRLAQLLLGVPKFRTCKPIKMTQKFRHVRLYEYNEEIVRCKVCANPHFVTTVCGECYKVVKAETDRIKVEEMKLHKVT